MSDGLDLSAEKMSGEEQEEDEELSVEDILSPPDEPRSDYDGYNDAYKEVERYWVFRPYAYIVILKNEEDLNRIYHVVEPETTDREDMLIDRAGMRLYDRLKTEDVDTDENTAKEVFRKREDILLREAINIARDYGVGFGQESLHKVLYYTERNFIRYGKIEPIMQDPHIEDISCIGVNIPVFVFHRQLEQVETNIEYQREELNSFVTQLAERSGKHISTADPVLDASLPDGSRAQLTLGEDIATRGSNFTIRKFKDEPLTPLNLIEYGTFSLEQMSYLWMAIENNMSLIFAGGTGSGKTTSMNAVSLFIPPNKKVISIEDTREVTLPHEAWIPMVTRDSFGGGRGDDGDGNNSSVDMFRLLRAALRQRPNYILVGEVRGTGARVLFQAMATGHTTYSTFHADEVDSVFQRLRNEPINVPNQMLRAIDIVSVQSETKVKGERERRNKTIAEVIGVEEGTGEMEYENYFSFSPAHDAHTEGAMISEVLSKIEEETGWGLDRVEEERNKREQLLSYMLENDITDYRESTRIIQAFMTDRDRVIKEMEEGTLTGESFKSMESIKV